MKEEAKGAPCKDGARKGEASVSKGNVGKDGEAKGEAGKNGEAAKDGARTGKDGAGSNAASVASKGKAAKGNAGASSARASNASAANSASNASAANSASNASAANSASKHPTPLGKLAATGVAALFVAAAALFGPGFLGPVSDRSSVPAPATSISSPGNASEEASLHFRNAKLLRDHYEKHGKEMGFANAEGYERAAAAVVSNPASLHKTQKEDGDDVYYLASTGEFVVVSTDGYLRTYYYADKGYFDRQ